MEINDINSTYKEVKHFRKETSIYYIPTGLGIYLLIYLIQQSWEPICKRNILRDRNATMNITQYHMPSKKSEFRGETREIANANYHDNIEEGH